MNELIKTLFNNFTVNGVVVPVSFLRYEGHGEPYVTYMRTNSDYALRGDDELLGYVDYYDFDVYSKDDYTEIIEAIKTILEANNFIYIPERSSGDFYETDTEYYHRTLSFAYQKQED